MLFSFPPSNLFAKLRSVKTYKCSNSYFIKENQDSNDEWSCVLHCQKHSSFVYATWKEAYTLQYFDELDIPVMFSIGADKEKFAYLQICTEKLRRENV